MLTIYWYTLWILFQWLQLLIVQPDSQMSSETVYQIIKLAFISSTTETILKLPQLIFQNTILYNKQCTMK